MWVTRKVAKLVKRKRIVFSRYKDKSHPSSGGYQQEMKKIIKQAKIDFKCKLAQIIKDDSKSFIAYARSKTKSTVKAGVLLNNGGVKTDSISEITEEFNNYFNSVFTAENVDNAPESEDIQSEPDISCINDCVFTLEDVKKKLSKLRQDKSTGADDIGPRLLYNTQHEICVPLYLLFPKSLDDGMIPDDWRSANVSPLYKSGSRTNVDNYRPVSLTSQI